MGEDTATIIGYAGYRVDTSAFSEYRFPPRYRFRLRVIASDLTRGCMLALPQDIADYGQQPESLEVALAIRMSMSIPFFRPVKQKDHQGNQSVIVDGALLSDLPVWLFDSDGAPEWPTFGFRLVTSGPPQVVRHKISGPIDELLALFLTAIEAHDAYYLKADSYVRTIPIDTLHIATTDFGLSVADKERLFQSGVTAAQQFLATWKFEQYKARYRSGQPAPTHREQILRTI